MSVQDSGQKDIFKTLQVQLCVLVASAFYTYFVMFTFSCRSRFTTGENPALPDFAASQ